MDGRGRWLSTVEAAQLSFEARHRLGPDSVAGKCSQQQPAAARLSQAAPAKAQLGVLGEWANQRALITSCLCRFISTPRATALLLSVSPRDHYYYDHGCLCSLLPRHLHPHHFSQAPQAAAPRDCCCRRSMKPKGKAVQRPLMPRPAASLLPTPASSTDIQAKNSSNSVQFDILPPAALKTALLRGSSTSSAATNASDSSYRPLSPTSPVAAAKGVPASRKRAHMPTMTKEKEDYKLPPPPTRSRRIIQMNPPIQESQSSTIAQSAASASAKTPVGETVTKSGSKRKQGNSTTAATKKSARKTAHSLIERRRRSKMNEEFGVLKNMIPACHGQEMHKLAILQVRKLIPLSVCLKMPEVVNIAIGEYRVYTLSRKVRRRTDVLALTWRHSRPLPSEESTTEYGRPRIRG